MGGAAFASGGWCLRAGGVFLPLRKVGFLPPSVVVGFPPEQTALDGLDATFDELDVTFDGSDATIDGLDVTIDGSDAKSDGLDVTFCLLLLGCWVFFSAGWVLEKVWWDMPGFKSQGGGGDIPQPWGDM